jgi:heme/copper-type cytochrome/quinol oxidase subunit 1
MPALTRWHIRMSLVFFILALMLAVLVAAQAPLKIVAPVYAFNPVFFHLFMVGWVAQLIFGVVFWMFPKYSKNKPRGDERLGWLVFWLLNVGLLLRVIAEPAQAVSPSPVLGWMLASSAVSQWMAGLFFVINTWGRVKER